MPDPMPLRNIFMWFHEVVHILIDAMTWQPCWGLCFQTIPLKLSAMGIYWFYLLTLPSSLVRNQIFIFFWESSFPRHAVLVRWLQDPTYSDLIRTLSIICFSKICSCEEREELLSLGSQAKPHKPEAYGPNPRLQGRSLIMMPTHGGNQGSGNIEHHLKLDQPSKFPVIGANTLSFG